MLKVPTPFGHEMAGRIAAIGAGGAGASGGSRFREGDRVVVLSNGGFGGIHDKLLRALGAGAGSGPAR